MNFIDFYKRRSLLLLLAMIAVPVSLFAQTADEMAKELEALYSKGAGTTISFVLDGEKNSLMFATGSSKFRLESPADLIISNGTTIWHYMKQKKEVIIDKASSNAASLSNAQEILKFSSNYSGVLSHKKDQFELQLSPSKSIEKLMSSTGGISQITFTFSRSPKSGIKIKKVTAKASSGNISIGNVKITTLQKLSDAQFTYLPAKDVKITDLRD